MGIVYCTFLLAVPSKFLLFRTTFNAADGSTFSSFDILVPIQAEESHLRECCLPIKQNAITFKHFNIPKLPAVNFKKGPVLQP